MGIENRIKLVAFKGQLQDFLMYLFVFYLGTCMR